MFFSAGMILPVSVSNTAFFLCRKAIENYLETGEKIQIPNLPEIFKRHIPVFVSLKKSNQTRGCAGTFFTEKSLAENLVDFSVVAATQDFRYRVVDKQELKEIKIQITIPEQSCEIRCISFYNPETEGLIVEKDGRQGIVLPGEAKTAEYALKIGLKNAGIEADRDVRLLKFKAQVFVEGDKN
ncbi:MAG: AMMECR1 family protein [Candidatus Omnitrophica bacterium]|nr:AMMECR1 family protein [Candidatus Omnitrophota bacterium]MCM8788204.1 AMMECR1 family protein [Candidatus Omnitrophota bacterium]